MTCPRCDSDEVSKLVKSPVSGCWEVYLCEVCHFTWRSTEPSNIADPLQYNPKFKVDAAKIKQYMVVPTVPESRSTSKRH